MSKEIIVAILALVGVFVTAGGSILTQVILSKRSDEKMLAELKHQSALNDQRLDAKLEKHQAVTDTKIEELTRKVEKHNNLIERTYGLEGRMNEAEHDIRDLKSKL